MPQRILITEPIVEDVIDHLRQEFDLDIGERGYYEEEDHLIQDIANYDALLCLLSNPVTENVLKQAKSLKIVANLAAGYDNIDIEAARNAGIHVTNTPGVLTDATADAAFSLLLAAARRIPEAERFIRAGEFDGWDPLGFLGMELKGRTLGILGMGRIGGAVAKRGRGFGMKILYHNRNPVEEKTERRLDATYVDSVLELARHSDVLSLNCPLNEETYHAVDQQVLEALGSDGILVNTARGAVVDEEALSHALHDGIIRAAALDVFEEEPKIHPSLFDLPNCVMTPHIGSATYTTRKKMGILAAESIKAALSGSDEADIPNLVT